MDRDLSILKADILEMRRLKTDLTTVYRTVRGHCTLDFASYFTLSDAATRGHQLKLMKQQAYSRVNCRTFSFTNRSTDHVFISCVYV